MKSLIDIIKKIISSNKTISELQLMHDEIEYFKGIKNQTPSCLLEDIKYIDKLTDLYFIKGEIDKRYKQYIISKLNKFPLDKACSMDFITDKINITPYEFSMVMFTNHDHEFSQYTPIKKNDKLYYHSGIYDNGTIIILNDNPDSLYCTIFYSKILSGWKVIEFNETHYYERIE